MKGYRYVTASHPSLIVASRHHALSAAERFMADNVHVSLTIYRLEVLYPVEIGDPLPVRASIVSEHGAGRATSGTFSNLLTADHKPTGYAEIKKAYDEACQALNELEAAQPPQPYADGQFTWPRINELEAAQPPTETHAPAESPPTKPSRTRARRTP